VRSKYHVTPTSDVTLVPKSFSQWQIDGEEETARAILCSRCPKPAKLPKHNIHAGYTNVSVSLRSGCLSEMGPGCPKTPTLLQGFDIKICFDHYIRHILKSRPTSDGPEIMFKKGCNTNEGHCSIQPSNAIFADALVTSLQQRNSREPTKFSSEHCSHWHLKVQRHQKMKK